MPKPGKDRYTLLSKVVRIANSASLAYQLRLKAIAKFLASTFSCQSLTIYLCDDSRRNLYYAVSTAAARSIVPCQIPFGDGIAGSCAALVEPICRPAGDLHSSEIAVGSESHFSAFPIFDDRTIYGVMTLGQNALIYPDDSDLELIQDMIVIIAGIIQRIGLSAGSQRRISNLTMLSELGSLLNRSVATEAIIPSILDSCHQKSGSCCTVLSLECGERSEPFRQYRIRSKARRSLSTLLEIESLCSAKVRHSGISLLINDLISDEELPPSYVCVPLKFENRVQGTLTFFGKHGPLGDCQNYSEEDRELFESMGMLISNALAGASSYQHVLRLSQENDHKLKELGLLYRLSNTMLSTIRLNKLMHLILSGLTSGTDSLFERAMLFLTNERAEVMQGMLGVTRESAAGLTQPLLDLDTTLSSRWDISEEDMARQQNSDFSSQVRASRLELNRTKNMASRAVLERRLVFVPDATKNRKVDKEFVKRFGITSFAAMPLLSKEKVLGVVVVDNPSSGRAIGKEDLRFLQLFTNQAGMAIENSLLYNRIEDANRKLRDAQERLLHGERLATIGEMAAGIAHELKSPLVSIGGFARRLHRKLPKGTDEATYVTTIVSEVGRLEKMLTDILSFSRKSTVCYSVCNMQDIVEEALAVVLPVFEESRITVIRKFPKNKLLAFLGDGQQLKQVFINLLTNAQESMHGGPGEIKIAAALNKQGGRDSVVVKLADTGGGIPVNSLSSIFNPFFTTKESGTGLGLPIANRIVTNHFGKIQVSNYPGVGVEFTIIIPVEPPPARQGE